MRHRSNAARLFYSQRSNRPLADAPTFDALDPFARRVAPRVVAAKEELHHSNNEFTTERSNVCARRSVKSSHPSHRIPGYELLAGEGIEIGALHEPAPLPSACSVRYADRLPRAQALEFFPELNPADVVNVDHLLDIDAEGLRAFSGGSFDFVVCNHVIEHLANPIAALSELFRVLRPQGRLVIAAPDKEFSFDQPRQLTSFEHLVDEWREGVTEVPDDHYLDFLRAVQPGALEEDAAGIASHLSSIRRRREHAHVWTAATFAEFLRRSFDLLGQRARPLLESLSSENRAEYFGVWEKLE